MMNIYDWSVPHLSTWQPYCGTLQFLLSYEQRGAPILCSHVQHRIFFCFDLSTAASRSDYRRVITRLNWSFLFLLFVNRDLFRLRGSFDVFYELSSSNFLRPQCGTRLHQSLPSFRVSWHVLNSFSAVVRTIFLFRINHWSSPSIRVAPCPFFQSAFSDKIQTRYRTFLAFGPTRQKLPVKAVLPELCQQQIDRHPWF